MENEKGFLAEAIAAIQDTAVRAGHQVVNLSVNDGAGGTVSVPALVLNGTEGETKVQSLGGMLEEARAFAKRSRLDGAKGPDRRVGVASHQSLKSFIEHANRFAAANSAVWADAASRKLVSVLNYHREGADSAAQWGDHRGVYACPLSEGWLAWGGGKVLELEQDDFAALLDERDLELATGELSSGKTAPDPSALVTLATNLEVYAHATAKRERDPSTGRVKISYAEEKGVSGQVMPPPAFLVGIPIFQDSSPQLVEVRLRVTVQEGHAEFALQIHAATARLRDAFNTLCDTVGRDTGLPVFVGTPE